MSMEYFTNLHKSFLESTAPQGELLKIYSQNWDRFKGLGFPNRKNEEWRYTNVAPIAKSEFALPQSVAVSLSEEEKNYVESFSSRVVFVNGVYNEAHSQFKANDFIRISQVSQEMASQNPKIMNSLRENQGEDGFTALNKAFTAEGAFVEIAENQSFSEPIHLIFLSQNQQGSVAIQPHNFIFVNKYSQAQILISYVSFDENQNFTNAITDVFVANAAKLHLNQIQAASPRSFHVGTTRVQQAQGSTVNHFQLALGAQIARENLNITLDGTEAHISQNGLYATQSKQLIDNHTSVDHKYPHATSEQLYKGILAGDSRAVFNGKVFVRPDAQKTDAKQLNQNLLLSGAASVDTKPQLEISADDVKCTHGATIGQVEQDEIFYFESRGISKEVAQQMLIEGYARDVLENIDNKNIQGVVLKLLKDRFLNHVTVG